MSITCTLSPVPRIPDENGAKEGTKVKMLSNKRIQKGPITKARNVERTSELPLRLA
jgi:hypothetical protein